MKNLRALSLSSLLFTNFDGNVACRSLQSGDTVAFAIPRRGDHQVRDEVVPEGGGHHDEVAALRALPGARHHGVRGDGADGRLLVLRDGIHGHSTR